MSEKINRSSEAAARVALRDNFVGNKKTFARSKELDRKIKREVEDKANERWLLKLLGK